MNLTLDLAPERLGRLQRTAQRTGKPVETVIEELIDTLPEETVETLEERKIPTFTEWKRARGEEPTEKPKTGAEAVAYWEEFGLLGSYGDMSLSSEEMARKLREESNRPRYA